MDDLVGYVFRTTCVGVCVSGLKSSRGKRRSFWTNDKSDSCSHQFAFALNVKNL